MNTTPSVSEDRGIEMLNINDLLVYSVGVSTGGLAEMRMVKKSPKTKVVATTLDLEGAKSARKNILNNSLYGKVEIKIEDITKPLPYKNGTFDYIYARLVLHYLSEKELVVALSEIYRILKTDGKIFIVVRSNQCHQATQDGVNYNHDSHMTSYEETDELGNKFKIKRFFHSEESIGRYIEQAGFTIDFIEKYDEILYKDFTRTIPSPYIDELIGVAAYIAD